MGSRDLLILIAILANLALLGWIAWLIFRKYEINQQARAERLEAFNKLIEKFGTAREFAEFINTEQGQKFMTDPVPVRSNPLSRVIWFASIGIIATGIGFANLINAWRLRFETDINYIHQVADSSYWGVMWLSLGIALLIVGAVNYILIKKWGLNGSR